MNTTSLHIAIEPDVKNQAEKIADEIGLSLSSVVKVLLKQFIRTGQLSVGMNETPTKYMLTSLKKSEDDVKKGRVISFTSGRDALEYLTKELHNEKNYTV